MIKENDKCYHDSLKTCFCICRNKSKEGTNHFSLSVHEDYSSKKKTCVESTQLECSPPNCAGGSAGGFCRWAVSESGVGSVSLGSAGGLRDAAPAEIKPGWGKGLPGAPEVCFPRAPLLVVCGK